jgi:hypothetical protein
MRGIMSVSRDETEYLRKQAWDYFEFHANQRLTTFNFYLVLAALISTALFSSINNLQIPWIGIFLGALLSVFSMIFRKLDQRNRDLIHNAENALKFFESKVKITENKKLDIARIFTQEEKKTEEKLLKNNWMFWNNYYCYSDCFKIIYWGFGILGFIGMFFSIVNIFQLIVSKCP